MPDKTIIYSKNAGENLVPLTVRIDWLPDGSILPLMYWTPDGSCYQVMPGHKFIKMAHLKDRGVGIRFKVRSKIIKTEYEEMLHTLHETYLYLADNWFCGKNIIDNRYGHAGKTYIPVTLDVFPDCDYELIYFRVRDERYLVEKTVDISPCGSFNAGGVGIRHKVNARLVNDSDDEDPMPHNSVRRMAALFFEVNKWFVPLKN